MPKPPILETIDWKSVYTSGQDFAAWLDSSDESAHKRMTDQMNALELSADAVTALEAVSKPVHVVAIAEDWCGDVLRHVPVLETLTLHCAHLHTRYITRESNPDLFARYLTNGGEAIPKFIFLSDAFVECGNWGPMPQPYKDLISRGKACDDVGSARKIIYDAYMSGADRADAIAELLHLISIASSTSVA